MDESAYFIHSLFLYKRQKQIISRALINIFLLR